MPPEVTNVLALTDEPLDYDEALPAHFQSASVRASDNTPAGNPITDDGATLGRVLFYDTLLSANGTVSCASCHRQDHAFSDVTTTSKGFAGGDTDRNAMGFANARFYAPGEFFWDHRAETLEDQVLMPIQNTVEMGLTLGELETRVAAQPYYPPLFDRAFGSRAIDSGRIARALAQFVRSVTSYRSRWDAEVASAPNVLVDFAGFTPQENEGKRVFFGAPQQGRPPGPSCATCHAPDALRGDNRALFFLDRPRNDGLDATPGIDDGVGAITGDPRDLGAFKSPELRNVALTGPYMHDGRFNTLEAVVAHYRSGIAAHPNLDPILAVPGTNPRVPVQLVMTDAEAAALVAFLRTLTDTELTVDPRFTDPFLAH